MRRLAIATMAALLAATAANSFQPREPAPIKPGGIHAAPTAQEHAAPPKPAAEKPKEAAKEAAKSDAHNPPVAAAPTVDAHNPPAAAAAAPTTDAHNPPPPAPPAAHQAPTAHGEHAAPTYPVEVLKSLLAGNKRYAASKMESPNCDSARRAEVAQGQHPVAIIVSCSDSRVPPEIIFDQGVGDLFVVRTAGEVVDDVALGSIEYAVEHLHAKLILVLGHERCGAVAATLGGGEAPGHIGKIVEFIKPAVEKGREKEGDKLTNCIHVNAKMIAEKIRSTEPIISEHVKDGVVRVVGGYYDLDTGMVEIIYSPDVSL